LTIDITSVSIGGVLGGALGYLFRVLIEHFLIKSRTVELRKQEDFDKAKRHFRSIVAQEIADTRTRKHVFKDSSHVNVLHTAMLEFQPFLSKDRQTALSTAWKEYQEHEEYRAWTRPEQDGPMPAGESLAKTEAIKFLNNLLAFTE
jgi:hypothetical protein